MVQLSFSDLAAELPTLMLQQHEVQIAIPKLVSDSRMPHCKATPSCHGAKYSRWPLDRYLDSDATS